MRCLGPRDAAHHPENARGLLLPVQAVHERRGFGGTVAGGADGRGCGNDVVVCDECTPIQLIGRLARSVASGPLPPLRGSAARCRLRRRSLQHERGTSAASGRGAAFDASLQGFEAEHLLDERPARFRTSRACERGWEARGDPEIFTAKTTLLMTKG